MSAEERLDGLFMNAVQQSQGIDNFFANLFGFFRRRTDLFADETMSKQKLMQSFEKNLVLYQEDQEKKRKLEAKRAQEKREAQLKKEREEAAKRKKEEEGGAQVEEITDEEAERLKAELTTGNAGGATKAKADGETKKEEDGEETKDGDKAKEDKGVKPNELNGGQTDKYHWGQTLAEVTVNVPIPYTTQAKHLKIDLNIKNMKVAYKTGEVIMEGEWCEPIYTEDSLWCIENVEGKRCIQLNITKKNQMTWWNCILQGDQKIDTQKVEPENSKLSDLDGETRSTVEKMMFDQKQKQLGLPDSDELQKRDKLAEFMKAHPEMDFSKAKFC